MDAVDLSKQFLAGKLTPLQVLEDAIARAKQYHGVFINYCLKRAYEEAQTATSRWKNKTPLSIFDGIPVSWKDLYDIENHYTTAGSLTQQKHPAQQDAYLVKQLTQMGMVNIGKTNLTEFAYSGLGLNPHFGTPHNAINKKHIPGGSSSGAAIAVARNITPIAMGTDTAGSIRIPAAFNGVVGFKPSRTRYNTTGVFPLSFSLDVCGPLAASVRDCYILDQLITSEKSTQEKITEGKFTQLLRIDGKINKLTFIVDQALLEKQSLASSVRKNFEQSVKNLQCLGCHIEIKKIPVLEEVLALFDQGLWVSAAEAYTQHQALLESKEAELLDPLVRKRLLTAKTTLASTQITLYKVMEQLRAELSLQLNGGFLLMPTVMHCAPSFEQVKMSEQDCFAINAKTLRLTALGNFLDMPGISIPNGVNALGLPTGLLISATSGNDVRLLETAMLIEDKIINKSH